MNKIYTRAIPLAAFGMSAALLWDAWWHVAVGRDEFWIAPHVTLYVCLAIMFMVSFLAWRKTKIREFRNLFLITCFFSVTGILDQVWHSVFGVENLVSPIVVWSPPHLLILASLITITLYSRKIVSFEQDSSLKWLMQCALFAGFLGFILIFMMPFYPLGSYHIAGYWGAGFLMFIFLLISLYEQKSINQTGTVILVTTIFMMLSTAGPASIVHPAQGIIIEPMHNPPLWLFIYSFMVPAIFIELAHSWNPITKGTIAGLLSGAIFYLSALYFIDVPNFYGIHEILVAVVSCTLGGLIAGVISYFFIPKNSFNNEIRSNSAN